MKVDVFGVHQEGKSPLGGQSYAVVRSDGHGGLGAHLPRPLTGSVALQRSFSLSLCLLFRSKREEDRSLSRFLWPMYFKETSLEKLPRALESELPSDPVGSPGRERGQPPQHSLPRGDYLIHCSLAGGQGSRPPGVCILPGSQGASF